MSHVLCTFPEPFMRPAKWQSCCWTRRQPPSPAEGGPAGGGASAHVQFLILPTPFNQPWCCERECSRQRAWGPALEAREELGELQQVGGSSIIGWAGGRLGKGGEYWVSLRNGEHLTGKTRDRHRDTMQTMGTGKGVRDPERKLAWTVVPDE